MGEIGCKCCGTLSVLQWNQDRGWEERRVHPRDLRVGNQSEAPLIISEDTRVYVIIASANEIHGCQNCKQALIDAFCMPQSWWSEYLKNSNGYFGCETTLDSGSPRGFSTWAFFETKKLEKDMRYDWAKINIFTRWLCSSGQTGILIFDPDKHSTSFPPLGLNPEVAPLGDPFWVYVHVLEKLARLEDCAVWSIRDRVRDIETEQEPEGKPQPEYRLLHDIARHAIHVTESLDVSVQTVEHILRHHENCYISPNHGSPSTGKQTSDIWHQIHARLAFFQSYLSSMRHRSISNEKRLQNEIQLAFNTVAQYDAGTSVKISRAMMSDSAALKTLAFITFAFLPPMFICAIFSMSFFDYDADSGWAVSGKFWIYWAFAIPTTIATAVLWHFWHQIFLRERLERKTKDMTKEIPLQETA